MQINCINNLNCKGNIINTNIKSLPKKVQDTLPVLNATIKERPYDVSLKYNKEYKILNFVYTQFDARVKKYTYSVDYSDKIYPLAEMMKGWQIFEEKQISPIKKVFERIKKFFAKDN